MSKGSNLVLRVFHGRRIGVDYFSHRKPDGAPSFLVESAAWKVLNGNPNADKFVSRRAPKFLARVRKKTLAG